MRHNKKRNTAFLFEVLVCELTKAIIHGDLQKQEKTRNIISKHFSKGKPLHENLSTYRVILETRGEDKNFAERILNEMKSQRKFILDDSVFQSQTDLIKDMNVEYTKSVFSNFVPNYKSLATIAQLFNTELPIRDKVLLETRVVEYMCSKPETQQEQNLQPIDNLVYKTFVQKFNDKYSDSLLSEQKILLNRFVGSFQDDGLELKVFLNSEIGRLKEALNSSLELPEISEDSIMLENAKKVILELESFSKREIDQPMIKSILKIQELVKELQDGN